MIAQNSFFVPEHQSRSRVSRVVVGLAVLVVETETAEQALSAAEAVVETDAPTGSERVNEREKIVSVSGTAVEIVTGGVVTADAQLQTEL